MRQRLMQILSSDETSQDASIDAAIGRFYGRKPRYVRPAAAPDSEGALVIELARWIERRERMERIEQARTRSFNAR